MVVERRRVEGENDHLRWYCDKLRRDPHDSKFQLVDLGKQLKPIIEEFYANEALRTCKKCGAVMQVPAPAPAAAK